MDAVPERAIRAVIGEVVGVVTRPRDLPPGSGDLVERYAAMLTRSRQDAVTRLIDMAVAAGADAIVGLRYDSSEITQGLSEVAAYGTAVQLAPTAGSRPVGSRSVGSSAASGPHPASDDKVTS